MHYCEDSFQKEFNFENSYSTDSNEHMWMESNQFNQTSYPRSENSI